MKEGVSTQHRGLRPGSAEGNFGRKVRSDANPSSVLDQWSFFSRSESKQPWTCI
jgi:hypothetical protein